MFNDKLIRLVTLESHQNENGSILGFLSKECVCHRLAAYSLFVSLSQISSNCLLGFGLLTYFHSWAWAWTLLGHV